VAFTGFKLRAPTTIRLPRFVHIFFNVSKVTISLFFIFCNMENFETDFNILWSFADIKAY